MPASRADDAHRIFSGIGATYERAGALLSFGQDARWRERLVSLLDAGSDDAVLDGATGTGLVARAIAERYRCRVVGLDRSADMLGAAAARDGHIPLVRARAESLPFPDESFDGLTFTYLLRYVDDPAATLRELARVVRPGGTVASLEFALPHGIWRLLWELYVRTLLPAAGRIISPGWGRVGTFLGPSIRDFYRRLPEPQLLELWRAAGIAEVRSRRLSLGGGIVVWGTKR